jgi:glycosyltransferase involved in cell wall biosynthesis
MKICFVLGLSNTLGANGAFLEPLDGLIRSGIDCKVIIPRKGPITDELKKRNIKFAIIPYMWWITKNDSPYWKRIAKIIITAFAIIPVYLQIRRWKCDLVYTNTIAICVGAFAAKLLRKPHVWHIHEFGYEDHGLRYILGEKTSIGLINKLSSLCIAISGAVAKKYIQYIPKEKIKIIYQSVSLPATPFVIKERVPFQIQCAIVGNVASGKGQADAIRAVHKVSSMGINVGLWIIGDAHPSSNYRKHLLETIEELKIDSRIRFLGQLEPSVCIQFMEGADVLLMCSRSEGFGRVTIEAMLRGTPVIGARSGATTELVKDEFNGLLYELHNTNDLASKIAYLYNNPEKAKQMSADCKKWAESTFTPEKYYSNIIKTLKNIFEEKHKS